MMGELSKSAVRYTLNLILATPFQKLMLRLCMFVEKFEASVVHTINEVSVSDPFCDILWLDLVNWNNIGLANGPSEFKAMAEES